MNNKRMTFGIGMALMILAVLTAPAAADSIGYFVPQHGNGTTGDWVAVTYYVDIEEGYDAAGTQQTIRFDPDIIDIVDTELLCDDSSPTGPDQYCWGAFDVNNDNTCNGFSWSFNGDPKRSVEKPPGSGNWKWESIMDTGIEGPATVEIATFWVQPQTDDTPGITPFNFNFEEWPVPGCDCCQESLLCNFTGIILPMTWYNGTFTHVGEPETFEKELAAGWNLISLPLTPTPGDNSTSEVLSSISYDAVYRYDVTAKEFEDVTTGTMDPGIGYFVNVTTATGTWTYEGTAYNSMSVDLKQGLNLVGWTNTSASITEDNALDSISGNYNYAAQWNVTSPSYGVYDANAPSGMPEFIDFETMERGNGYWIAAKDNCTLSVS